MTDHRFPLSSDTDPTSPAHRPGLSRRTFIGGTGAAAAIAALGATAGVVEPAKGQTPVPICGQDPVARREEAYQIRVDAATKERDIQLPPHPTNGDENRYPARIGNFSKGLPHNAYGEVDLAAYNSLLTAVCSQLPSDFERIQLKGGTKLVNPQGGLAFDLEGGDGPALAPIPCSLWQQYSASWCPVPPQPMPSYPPALASAEEAAEGVELYWMSLLRDVSFASYPSDPNVKAAIDNLNGLNDFRGPRDPATGKVSAQTVFRDPLPGATVGPYVSQYLLQPVPYGAQVIDNRVLPIKPGLDFLTKVAEWKSVQDGYPPSASLEYDPRRYVRDARDLASFVHLDVLFQAYFNACLILATPPQPADTESGGVGAPLNPGNPYLHSLTQVGFTTFGVPHLKSLMCEVATRALKATWYEKWFVHRRLRPEAWGGLVHFQKTENRYPGVIHPDQLNSPALERVWAKYGTYLLPQSFPEGSPLHPSYTAGHATVGGACVTILKAMFDESYVIANPVEPSADGLSLVPLSGPPLTVGGELNKLASNIGTGRNHAGVHWRSDAYWSFLLGEEIAIRVLRDQRATYNENKENFFKGLTFTKFNGDRVTI